MHTTECAGVRFHHNGDFSGDVRIELPRVPSRPEDAVRLFAGTGEIGQWVEVPFEALKELVADYVSGRRIAHLEQASPDEVLGVPGEGG